MVRIVFCTVLKRFNLIQPKIERSDIGGALEGVFSFDTIAIVNAPLAVHVYYKYSESPKLLS